MRVLEFALLGSLLVCSAHCFSINSPLFAVQKSLSLRCGRSVPALATCQIRRTRPIAMSAKTAGDIETIKSDLLTQLSVGSGLKQAADQANRIKVSEALLQLEPHNPTGTNWCTHLTWTCN
jgi:hypothetical protein